MSIDRPTLSLKKQPVKEAQHPTVNDKPPQSTNSIAELSKTLSMLVDQFPAVFASKVRSKPLKIGILDDLRACYPKISKKTFPISVVTLHRTYQLSERLTELERSLRSSGALLWGGNGEAKGVGEAKNK